MIAKGAAVAVLLAGTVSVAAEAAEGPSAPPGAAACSGCHPPSAEAGAAVAPLNGRAAEEIVSAMQAFRSGSREATVMDRIAKGFTDEETRAIAAWLGEQR